MKWSLELRPEPQSVAIAREAVRERLGPVVGAGLSSDVELVVSELVTNSVRHGPGKAITLRVYAESRRRVSGEVVDHGDGVVAIREAGADRGGRPGGMGLPIVDSVATDWGVYEGSTHVWFLIER
jgi:anti-sigma regulatory factor (Ser/Thr protein kinase)